MNKTGLVEAIALKAKVSKVEAAKVVDAAVDVIVEALKKGEAVQLVGIATLSVVEKKARKGINPLTKQAIEIPARKAIKFKAGSKLAL
ncbi:MAG: HU family DNA-binding protein [Paludibacteraceae bacterium]|nr:HU family DNA-binding protein [Paludibacteraceae bacterium]